MRRPLFLVTIEMYSIWCSICIVFLVLLLIFLILLISELLSPPQVTFQLLHNYIFIICD